MAHGTSWHHPNTVAIRRPWRGVSPVAAAAAYNRMLGGAPGEATGDLPRGWGGGEQMSTVRGEDVEVTYHW